MRLLVFGNDLPMAATETSTGLSFDDWGTPLGAAPSRRTRSRGVVRLALAALVAAIVAALAVHFSGGAAAPPVSASQSAANAINLRLSDLPGFRLGSNSGVRESGSPGSAFSGCFAMRTVSAGRADNVLTAAAVPESGSFSSPDFVQGNGLSVVSLGSQVTFASKAMIAGDAATGGNPRFGQCFAEALASISYDAHGTQVTGSDPASQTLPVPVAPQRGVDPLLGMRASIVWSANGMQIPVTVDAYVVAVGHDEVSLIDFTTMQPYPTSAESQLLALLVSRALAQPH